jgi:hypothetical protein
MLLGRNLVGCLVALVVTLVLGIVAGRFMVNPAEPIPFEGSVEVDPDDLRCHVEALTGVGGYRSYEHPEVLDRAADVIRSRWREAGYEVEEQPFEINGTTYRNLIVSHGPEGAPVVVIGAHYDVCGDQDGADDNASAVAAVIELARMLARYRPQLDHRIEIVAFTLEEPPFFRTRAMGSHVHARSLRDRGVEVTAMICLEMIGYFSDVPGSQGFPIPGLGLLYPRTGNFIAVVGNTGGRRLTREVKSLMAGACAVPVHSINAPALVPGLDFSDHRSYWKNGFPAVMVTDSAFYRNPNYHLPSDTADTLDYARMAEVTKGLYAAIIGRARG